MPIPSQTTTLTLEQAQYLLDEIDQHGKGVTDREADFLDSMLKWTDAGNTPTAKQAAWLLDIHVARMPE